MATAPTQTGVRNAPAPGSYALDAIHSYVSFTARHLMVTKVRGRFPVTGGRLVVGDDPAQSSVEATIDVTAVESGDPKRDEHLRSADFFDSANFPTATFTLTTPVAVPSAALAGTALDVTLAGDLTLHGVTKSVSIPAKAQLVDGVVSVAGSISFPLSDYSITAPNIGGFIVSIADTGTLEFLANFTKA